MGVPAWIALTLFLALDEPRQTIHLQPLGKVPAHSISVARDGIERMFDAKVVIEDPMTLPRSAYYRPMRRYRADNLLEFLATNGESHVIGLTTADISTTKGKIFDWGVIGLGQIGGASCVVSTFRLGRSGAVFDVRLVNAANHELGHTFGLKHCPQSTCVMHDYQGKLTATDNHLLTFCSGCAPKLKSVLR